MNIKQQNSDATDAVLRAHAETVYHTVQAALVACWSVAQGRASFLTQFNPGSVSIELELSEEDHAQLITSIQPDSSPTFVQFSSHALMLFATNLPIGPVVFEAILEHAAENHTREQLERRTQALQRCFQSHRAQPKEEKETEKESSALLSSTQLEEFQSLILSSPRLRPTAMQVANELRRVYNLDRVSIARNTGLGWKMIAISGQATVNRKSRTVRKLERLVRVCCQTGTTTDLVDGGLPTPIEELFDQYREISEVQSARVVPISDQGINDTRKSDSSSPIAAIVFESYTRADVSDCEGVHLDLSRNAVRNASAVDNIPLINALDALRRTCGRRSIARHPWRFIFVSALLIACVVMLFVKVDFYVAGEGKILPVERRRIFSGIEGVVATIHVDHGQKVGKGDVLLEIRNSDIDFELEQVSGDILELQEQLEALAANRISVLREKEEVDTNVRGLRKQLEALQHLRETLDRKRKLLTIHSPIDGTVVSWKAREMLEDRPVTPGQPLLDIANTEGRWELQVAIPIRNIGFVRQHAPTNSEVRYILPSRSQVWKRGALRELETSSRISADGSQNVMAWINVDETFPDYATNNSVIAKVYCGRKTLGFVCFYEIWYYLRENVFFPYWPF